MSWGCGGVTGVGALGLARGDRGLWRGNKYRGDGACGVIKVGVMGCEYWVPGL